MREIWQMQPRFEKRVGSAAFGLAEQPRFRAAFDFMRLRAENGELDEVLSDWWEQFSLADDNLRRDMIDEVKQEQQQRARPTRPPRPNKAAMRQAGQPPFGPADTDQAVNPPASALGNQAIDGALGPNPDAPKKRRRRRRNPGSSADRGDASGSLPDASAA
jgi:poly(A) polymerase